MSGLLIGDVAQRAGVTTPTIRYYERLGLLPAASRSAAGYRRYTDATVEQLRFIRKAQALGFSLDEIAGILELTRSGATPCSRVLSLGHQHLEAVAARIRQLQQFHALLGAELAKWEQQQTAVSSGGVCQFITQADEQVVSPDHLTHRRRTDVKSARGDRKARG
jgi:DNA-binding transcriptional MerR regulator